LEQRTLLPELRHHGPAAMGACDATFCNAEAAALGRRLVPWLGCKYKSDGTYQAMQATAEGVSALRACPAHQ